MANKNPFAIAEGRRIEITEEQSKQIRQMYKDIRKEFKQRIDALSKRSNISSVMRVQYLKEFQKDLENEIRILNAQLEGTIKSNILNVSRAVVLDSNNLAREMGFSGIFTSDYYIPTQVVNDLISGRLYEGKWTLSKAIWSDNQKKLGDINQIIAKGVAENKPTYDIAKDLERYVNPNARKDWKWSKVYPGSSKKVDYNAQRLARTMVSHAYQESFVQSTKDNPFIESYRWLASGGDRMCDICAERDGKIFAKDELPMDHPNGMCTFEVVIEKSYEQIARDLHNWIYDEGDSKLNSQLDDYAETLGYNVKGMTSQNPKVQDTNMQVQNQNNVIKQNFVPTNAKEFSEKWGISISGIKEDAIKNIDSALAYMRSEFGIDPKEYIAIIDNKNPDLARRYKAYYYPYNDKGIHIHKDYSGGKYQALSPSDAVHEIMHALHGHIAINDNGYVSDTKQSKLGDEIVAKVFSENGYVINNKTGLPSKEDIAKVVTKYGSTNSNECIAEAALLTYEHNILGRNINEERYKVVSGICDEIKRRLNDNIKH